MATMDNGDDRYLGLDVDSILSRVESRPLTFHRKRSLNRAPEFVKRLTGEQTVDEGQDAHFDCKVDGFPKPSVRWFKDDQEIVDHPRIHWQVREDGSFTLTLESVTKGDEAAYRCRAENVEGQTSCTFFLSVKGKPKSSRRSGRSLGRRTVSYPPMFTTIVEKVEEEEKAAREAAREPPSPLTELYNGTTLKQRGTWPNFLGEWAFKPDHPRHRTGSAGSLGSGGSLGSEADEDVFDVTSFPGGGHHDDVFIEGDEGANPTPHHGEGGASSPQEANPRAPAFYLGEESEQDGGTEVTSRDADQDQDAGQGRQLRKEQGRGESGKPDQKTSSHQDGFQHPAMTAGHTPDLRDALVAKDAVSVANDRLPSQAAKEPAKNAAKESLKETAKEAVKDTTKKTVIDTAKEAVKDTTNQVAKDASKGAANKTANETAKKTVKETAKETSRDDAKEAAKKTGQETPKGPAKEHAKEPAKELAQKSAKDTAKESAMGPAKDTAKESAKLAARDTAKESAKLSAKETGKDERTKEEVWDSGQVTSLVKEPNNNDARLTAGCRLTDAGRVAKAVTSPAVTSPGSESATSPPAQTATSALHTAALNNKVTSTPVSTSAATVDGRGQLSASLVSGPRARAPSPSPVRSAHHARPLQVMPRAGSEVKVKEGSKVRIIPVMREEQEERGRSRVRQNTSGFQHTRRPSPMPTMLTLSASSSFTAMPPSPSLTPPTSMPPSPSVRSPTPRSPSPSVTSIFVPTLILRPSLTPTPRLTSVTPTPSLTSVTPTSPLTSVSPSRSMIVLAGRRGQRPQEVESSCTVIRVVKSGSGVGLTFNLDVKKT